MADGPAVEMVLMSVLRRALADPGKSVERKTRPVLEPLYLWQARAVIAAIEAAGLSVVATTDLERLRARPAGESNEEATTTSKEQGECLLAAR